MDTRALQFIRDISNYLEVLTSKGIEQANKIKIENNGGIESPEIQQLANVFARFKKMLTEAYTFQKYIAAGKLEAEVDKYNYLAMPLRGLQASLRHLTWQARQVAQGDLEQNVYFLGEFSDSFNTMIESLKEKELMQIRLMQAQKMKSVGQLAAGVAHELNTPCQFIGTNLEFIQDAFSDLSQLIKVVESELANLDDASRQKLESALEKADWSYLSEELPDALLQSTQGMNRISEIVLAMKSFSHPPTKTMAPTDLNALIKTTLTITEGTWREYVDIKENLQTDLPEVSILADEMGQAILNLLLNAIDAIKDEAKDDGYIQVETKRDGDSITLQIRDNGIGMTQDVQSRIYEPFFTTKEVGSGSGQGMAMVYDVIVKKHNGTIECESTPHQGTTFTIRLPLSTESAATE